MYSAKVLSERVVKLSEIEFAGLACQPAGLRTDPGFLLINEVTIALTPKMLDPAFSAFDPGDSVLVDVGLANGNGAVHVELEAAPEAALACLSIVGCHAPLDGDQQASRNVGGAFDRAIRVSSSFSGEYDNSYREVVPDGCLDRGVHAQRPGVSRAGALRSELPHVGVQGYRSVRAFRH